MQRAASTSPKAQGCLSAMAAEASWSAAPSGKTPVWSKRHRAMSHFRATATRPMRLNRLPPLPQRSRNQPRRALSGWYRLQRPATSVVIQRTGRCPDLVRHCSRALAPLCYGVGVKPAQPPLTTILALAPAKKLHHPYPRSIAPDAFQGPALTDLLA